MLNQQQIEQFQQQGYLVVENVLDTEHLDAVHTEYAERMDELYQQWHTAGLVGMPPEGLSFWEKLDLCYNASGFDWFQSFDISLPGEDIREDTPMHFGPAIFNIVRNENLLDIIESFIGPEITSNPIQHVRIKPPEGLLPQGEIRAHITATDWHQDRGVGHAESDNTDMITAWIAINDATIENGCLQVIPGPHNKMLPHCPKVQTAIADEFIDEAAAVPLPVKAGGVVLFHPLTPHSSLSNTSEGFRWSFDLRYNVTGQPTGRAHFPEFIARSKVDSANELHDWQAWKKLWEDARHRVANAPHIDQHRWRSDSPFCA